jgi:hypothetical protein
MAASSADRAARPHPRASPVPASTPSSTSTSGRDRHQAGGDEVADEELAAVAGLDHLAEQARPTAPPMPVEMAKKNAIAIARISIGNVSLIVR